MRELVFYLHSCLFHQVTNNRSSEAYTFDHDSMARRALKNTCLGMSFNLAF